MKDVLSDNKIVIYEGLRWQKIDYRKPVIGEYRWAFGRVERCSGEYHTEWPIMIPVGIVDFQI